MLMDTGEAVQLMFPGPVGQVFSAHHKGCQTCFIGPEVGKVGGNVFFVEDGTHLWTTAG